MGGDALTSTTSAEEVIKYLDLITSQAENTAFRYDEAGILYAGIFALRHRLAHPEEYGED